MAAFDPVYSGIPALDQALDNIRYKYPDLADRYSSALRLCKKGRKTKRVVK